MAAWRHDDQYTAICILLHYSRRSVEGISSREPIIVQRAESLVSRIDPTRRQNLDVTSTKYSDMGKFDVLLRTSRLLLPVRLRQTHKRTMS
jgi:hypothetical protein